MTKLSAIKYYEDSDFDVDECYLYAVTFVFGDIHSPPLSTYDNDPDESI